MSSTIDRCQSWRNVGQSLGRKAFRPMGKGDHGLRVRKLQAALVRWMPAWKGKLAVDGEYGPQTAAALAVFKATYGLGVDGNSLDPSTARALRSVRDGSWWRGKAMPLAKEQIYERARKHGFPFDLEHRLRQLPPSQLVTCDGFPMQAATALRWLDFNRRLEIELPGFAAYLTCTTGGTHASPAHAEGRAVDCVVEDPRGYPVTLEESWLAAGVAEACGFSVFNEYAHDSLYKTGDHLHLEAPAP